MGREIRAKGKVTGKTFGLSVAEGFVPQSCSIRRESPMKRLLVALDDSPRAACVFDVGAEFAEKFGTELYLFHTIMVPEEFSAAAATSEPDSLPAHLVEMAKRELFALSKRAPSVVVKERIVTYGVPAKMILETTEDLNVDLIVMGSHEYRGWDRVLGTTAATIANRSTRNALIVHDRTIGNG